MLKFDRIVTTDNKSVWRNSCEYIVLHHTWNWSYEWNITTLSVSKWEKAVSCHYVVAQDWRVAKIWNHTDILWHAWQSEWEWMSGLNKNAIWIEVINVWTTFTDAQRDVVRELVSDIMKEHNIPANRIIRHKDIAPKRKVDIYDTFRNNKFKTFQEYQESFKAAPTGVEQAKAAIKANWELRHATDNTEVKKQLEETNNLLRSVYKLPK